MPSGPQTAPNAERPILSLSDVVVSFPERQTMFDRVAGRPHRSVHALNAVRFDLFRDETLGIIGESGCGKSTLARTIVGLESPDDGRIYFNGSEITSLSSSGKRDYNRKVQMIFQDPFNALNPRMTVRATITEPMRAHGIHSGDALETRFNELMELVQLAPESADRYPHEFSGGQRQRIAIARALAVAPEVLIADEVVSALDVSVQAQIVNLLIQLQDELGLTVIFVSHDLRLVRHVSHRVAVMYLGSVVEIGKANEIFAAPHHPYTQALVASAPIFNRSALRGAQRGTPAAAGELPSPFAIPSGCPFRTRCAAAMPDCANVKPILKEVGPARRSACLLPAV